MNMIWFFLVLMLVLLSLGLYRNWKVQSSPNQKVFAEGTIPSPKPDGFLKGSVKGLTTAWQGKKFEASKSAGVNLLAGEEKYPFKTYVSKGIQDKALDVYKIDYNIPQNPFWLKFILDEIVQIAPGKYLGKVHINLIPGLPFTLGFFSLEK